MSERKRKYITPKIEHRQYRRVTLAAKVQCAPLGREAILVTRNVSAGGIFVTTNSPFPRECDVTLSFSLRPTEAPISCRGRVLYALEGLGMGIAFVDLKDADRRRLQKFVDEAV